MRITVMIRIDVIVIRYVKIKYLLFVYTKFFYQKVKSKIFYIYVKYFD